jgi:hypothetical protein
MLLKGSEFKAEVTPDLIAALAAPAAGDDVHRREFLQLVDAAARLMADRKALAR